MGLQRQHKCRAGRQGVQRCCAQVNGATGQGAKPLRVRTAKVRDCGPVSRLCAEVFAREQTDLFRKQAPYLDAWLSLLEDWYSDQITKELTKQLAKSLAQKQLATRESQTLKLRYETAEKRTATQLVGGFASTPAARNLRRLIATKDAQRMFCCLLAENDDGEIVASVTVSMTVPDAKLPPPFPTRGVQRFYIGNMVVREDYRRKGLATSMLRECEKLAKRWNCDSTWLHVGVVSDGAQSLYKGLGYSQKGVDPWYYVLEKRYLYCKELPLPPNSKFRRIGEKSRGTENAALSER
ncbi:N-acetyltransferase domain-containing protein [Chloropicon primus]|uniref:N-acetyltransferase domain-containing protein n=1 Tax=Chloropicon primus TaxID=1764295 RepID=A0A5B8MMX3_9CHLO|nr:hypothetical protein A3770_06p44240 [Chloropicon primus]UPR01127.1 N-acetyltransferase domain-containing protein [Chloropicon primus]|eukprot:QDZ21906.1 hypothetical protein A3770_06p44240 [Chloropicon primus]